MSFKYVIYCYPDSYRVWKSLITAEYANISIEYPPFEFGKDNRTPDFLKNKNPFGKVPVMDTPEGPLWESGAIQRYVGRLSPEAGLYGQDIYESGEVDQWLDFNTNEIDIPRARWLGPIARWMPYKPEAHEVAKKDLFRSLHTLNTHLTDRTYLVGNQVTMADIAVVSGLVELFRKVLVKQYLVGLDNLIRWFNLCMNQPQFKKIIGTVVFAEKEQLADASSSSSSSSSTPSPVSIPKQSTSSHSNNSPTSPINTKEAEEAKDRGNKLLAEKKYEQAIEAYTQAIKSNPANPVYYANRSFVYFTLKNYGVAISDAKQAIEHDASYAKGHYRLYQSSLALKDYKQSVSSLEQVLKLTDSKASDKKSLEAQLKEAKAKLATAAPVKEEKKEEDGEDEDYVVV